MAIFLSACVSDSIVPARERTARLSHAHIVAMETRPLSVPSAYIKQLPVAAAGGSVSAARGAEVFNTVAIFAQLPEANRRAHEAAKSAGMFAWSPSNALAAEVARQLAARGITAQADAATKPLPGVKDRSATFFMENWMPAIRAHYDDPGPVHDYDALASDPALFVMEVSISNYEVFDSQLVLQVHLKMIDPSSGAVIGRARANNALNMPRLPAADEAFANSAEKFKEIFSRTGAELVGKCLDEMGLSSSARGQGL